VISSPQGWTKRAAGVLGLAIALCAPSIVPAEQTTREIMRFAAEMAREGNWREARFRWEQALGQDPGNYRVLNNLGVAWEALGDPKKAREAYQKALAEKRARPIEVNLERFERAWKSIDPAEERDA